MYRWPIRIGDRVALAPHTDDWMCGRRFAEVIESFVNEENVRYYLASFGWADSVWLTSEDLLGAVRS